MHPKRRHQKPSGGAGRSRRSQRHAQTQPRLHNHTTSPTEHSPNPARRQLHAAPTCTGVLEPPPTLRSPITLPAAPHDSHNHLVYFSSSQRNDKISLQTDTNHPSQPIPRTDHAARSLDTFQTDTSAATATSKDASIDPILTMEAKGTERGVASISGHPYIFQLERPHKFQLNGFYFFQWRTLPQQRKRERYR